MTANGYEHLLSVRDLHTNFQTDSGEVHAVNGVSFVSCSSKTFLRTGPHVPFAPSS